MDRLTRDLVGDLPRDPDTALQFDVYRDRPQAEIVGDADHGHQVGLALGRGDPNLVALALGHAEQPIAALPVGDGAEEPVVDEAAGEQVALDDGSGDGLAGILVADDADDWP